MKDHEKRELVNELRDVAVKYAGTQQLREHIAHVVNVRVPADLEKEAARKMATDFYYWWHNQPGTNTQQGFDEWWREHHKKEYLDIPAFLRNPGSVVDKRAKTVTMPTELTAENGAKGLLSGEFKESVPVQCPDCCGLGHNQNMDQCKTCDGLEALTQDVVVTWPTIKEIYAMAVKHLSK